MGWGKITKCLPPSIQIICCCFVVFSEPPPLPTPCTRIRKPHFTSCLLFPSFSYTFPGFPIFMAFSVFPVLLLGCRNPTLALLLNRTCFTSCLQRLLPFRGCHHLVWVEGSLPSCGCAMPNYRYLLICRCFHLLFNLINLCTSGLGTKDVWLSLVYYRNSVIFILCLLVYWQNPFQRLYTPWGSGPFYLCSP